MIFISHGSIITVAPFGNSDAADYTCDGVNDEVEIQTALCELKGFSTISSDCGQYNSDPDSISDAIKEMGGTVRLLAGTFYITENIRIYSNSILEGEGIDLSIIKVDDSAPEFPNAGVIRMAGTDNNIIQDFTINGNKDSDVFDGSNPTSKYRYGVYTLNSSRIHMRRVRAYNCPGYGFDPHGVPGSKDSTDYMVIEDSYAEDNNLDGFTIDKSYFVTVSNNWAIDNHRNGFELTTGAVAVNIINNHAINNGIVYSSGGCGIKIQDQYNNGGYWGTQMATVSNNYISGSGGTGICIVEASEILIDGNLTKDGQSHCIRLRDTSYDGQDGAPDGDSGQGADNSIVSNNICLNNVYGINIEDTDGAIVNGNRVTLLTDYTDNGIQLKRTTNTIVANNNLCKTNGVDTDSTSENGNNEIHDNLVCNTTPEPTPNPTPSPTVLGQTPAPTPNPTPAPTIGIVPQTITIIADETIFYETDDDRIFDTWKQQNNDFVNTDISAWGNGLRLYDGADIHMKIHLDDATEGYYPMRFEYTSMNTNNNHGIIFTSPAPEGGWVNGWNNMTRILEPNDYYGTPDWADMDRFQLYWSDEGPWEITENKQITVEYVKVGNPDAFN